MADRWDVVIRSLGETCVAYLGSDGLRGLRIWSQPAEGSAHIEIALLKDSWEGRSSAVEVMVDIREMFIDDLSFDYRFVGADEELQGSGNPRDRLAEFASR